MEPIEKLLEVMARLRDPAAGCPWDRDQNFASIAPYTVEEAYEVADAVAREDLGALRDELDDLLFQVVFHARMAEEAGAFAFDDVATAITDKLLRRHPHVFGTAEERLRGAVPGAWERIKAEERRRAAANDDSALAGVPLALPALKRAEKLGARAARVGFDWPAADGAREKLDEELAELDEARVQSDRARVTEELGDLLLAAVSLARHLEIDAEDALARANRKFERRFRHMEASARADGHDLADLPLESLEAYWQAAK